jgi:hypothetical protein
MSEASPQAAMPSPTEKVTHRMEHSELEDDPHRAALEDNPDHVQTLTWPIGLSALFLGMSFPGPIMFGFVMVTPILTQLTQILGRDGGAVNAYWIPGGWGESTHEVKRLSVADCLEQVLRPV